MPESGKSGSEGGGFRKGPAYPTGGAPMYYDFTVPIPKVQGKITLMPKRSIKYVQIETGRVYLPEKKYTIPERVSIGKVDPDHPDQMFPNDRYADFFPDTPMPEERPEAYRSCALRIGSYLVIKQVLKEFKIPMMLDKYLEDNAGLFLDLVSFMIIDEENVGMHYPDFAFCHPLFSPNMRIYSDVKVSRLLNSISKDQIIGFLNDWNEKRDHKQRIYISYDSSNKNCQAGDIDLVEFGKPKDDKGKPIFNVSIAFDKTHQIPLLYEEYPGSINDVSQFSYMVDKVNEYGYKNIGFILDRGYFSEDNIQYMEDNGYAFIIMVKGRKKLVASLVEENRNTFETVRSCAIRSYRVYGKTVQAKLFDHDKKNRFIHIFFDPSKQAAEREQLEQKVEKYRVFLEKHIGTETKFAKGYHEHFTLKYDKNGILCSVKERTDVVEQELRLCGYFCIVTSEEMSASQALIQYKGRDISEKLFSADKTFLGSNSMRIHSSKAMSAKIFVEFVALIVRNRIYNLLKQTMLRIEGKQNYLTVPKALRELEKIEMIRRNNGRYRLDHAINKKQKIILSSFGISEEDVIKAAAEISTLLAKNQSLLPEDGDDDEWEEVDFGGEDEDDFIY